MGRTSATLLDLAVAVATGIAGSFALSRKDVSDILAGVAIAISLVPVLAVVGITLGSGRTDLALGAFVLFLTNAAAILVAGAAWHVDSVTMSGDEIVVNVIGPGASPGIARLKAAIRRDVPVSVPVKVIEESGSATPL